MFALQVVLLMHSFKHFPQFSPSKVGKISMNVVESAADVKPPCLVRFPFNVFDKGCTKGGRGGKPMFKKIQISKLCDMMRG